MTRDDGTVPLGHPASDPTDFEADPSDLSVFDPELVLGYFRRLERILDACPIDIYAASSFKHPWPHRLQNAGEVYPASFWRSPHRLLDSDISDPTLTNEDVLAIAHEKEATEVVAKDYLPFDVYRENADRLGLDAAALEVVDELEDRHGDNVAATTASIRRFTEVYDPSRDPPAFVPLQPPYADHYREVRQLLEDANLDARYMLGGLKDADTSRRLEELRAFREVAGFDPWAHGLGWGVTEQLASALRNEPRLLDSLDTGSPANNIRNGKLQDARWASVEYHRSRGDYQNTIGGGLEFQVLLQAAHRLTGFYDEADRAPEQTGLGAFGDATEVSVDD